MRGLFLIGVVALLALFLGLDRVDFLDDREARDAAIAREIVTGRELLTPRLGGQPWFEKPLLGYSLEIGGAWLTPGSPVGPRALRALGAVLLTLLVAAVGARHFGRRAGACAAAVFATSLALPLAARSDGTQVIAAGLAWLAFSLWLEVLGGRRPGARLAVAYLLLAVVVVFAGPLPALWPFLAITLTLARTRQWGLWARLHPLPGLAIVVGLALPWYGAMLHREGPGFAVRMVEFPYATPSVASWFTAPARALGYLFVGFFPWSAALAAALLRATGRRAATVDPASGTIPTPESFVLGALVAALLPVLLAPASPPSAILALLPAAALLAGPLIEGALGGEILWQRALGHASWVIAITGTVAAGLMSSISSNLGPADSEVRLAAVVLFALSWAPLLAAFMRRPRILPALLALPVALGTVLVSWRTLPALADFVTTRSMAESMAQVAPATAALVLLDPPPASLRLRAGRPLVVADDLAADLRRFRSRDGYTYVAFREQDRSRLARTVAPLPLEILSRVATLSLARVAVE